MDVSSFFELMRLIGEVLVCIALIVVGVSVARNPDRLAARFTGSGRSLESQRFSARCLGVSSTILAAIYAISAVAAYVTTQMVTAQQ